MAQFNITALTCGTCHHSGIAAWRSVDDAPCEVIFVSATFRQNAAAPGATPAFTCVECKEAAVLRPLLK